jgi:hypothetical protein
MERKYSARAVLSESSYREVNTLKRAVFPERPFPHTRLRCLPLSQPLIGLPNPDLLDLLQNIPLKINLEGIGKAIPHVPEPDEKSKFHHLIRAKMLLQRGKPLQRGLPEFGDLLGKTQCDFLLLGKQWTLERMLI